MNKLKSLLFVLPLLALIFMYANQGIGVFTGSPEHYDIVAALHWSPEITTALVWSSVVVDLGIALLLLLVPGPRVFLLAGLWTFVPRIITLIAPGPDNEFLESLAVVILAILSYLAYKRGYTIPIKKWLKN